MKTVSPEGDGVSHQAGVWPAGFVRFDTSSWQAGSTAGSVSGVTRVPFGEKVIAGKRRRLPSRLSDGRSVPCHGVQGRRGIARCRRLRRQSRVNAYSGIEAIEIA